MKLQTINEALAGSSITKEEFIEIYNRLLKESKKEGLLELDVDMFHNMKCDAGLALATVQEFLKNQQ